MEDVTIIAILIPPAIVPRAEVTPANPDAARTPTAAAGPLT